MTIQPLCLFSNGTAWNDYTILLCSSTKIADTLFVCQIAMGRHLFLHKYQAASKHIQHHVRSDGRGEIDTAEIEHPIIESCPAPPM